MKKLILLVGIVLVIQSCRKDRPAFNNKVVADNSKSILSTGSYIVNCAVKKISTIDSSHYNYEIDLWVASSANPSVALKLPGNLTISGVANTGAGSKSFTATLPTGSTISKVNYALVSPVLITGVGVNPSGYQGITLSFNGTFTENLVAYDSPFPALFFGAADVPAIQQKVQTGWLAATFAKMKTQADGFLTINTNPYNPGSVAIAGRTINTQVNTLALTGYILNDRRYINKAIDIMCAAANQYSSEDFDGFNGHLAVGDAAHAYAVGYDWLYPFMTTAQRTLMKNEIQEFGLWLYTCSSGGSSCYGDFGSVDLSCNHNAVVHGALGLCALVLGNEPAWLDLATRHVSGYFQYSTDDDGYSYEGLSYYAYGSLGSVPFSVALLRKGGPDLVAQYPQTKLIPNWILRQAFPWGSGYITMNDCGPYMGSVGGFMHLVSKFHDRVGLWTWLRLMGPTSGGGDGTYGIDGAYLGGGSSAPYVILFADKDLQPLSPIDAGLDPSYFFTSTGANPGGRVSFRSGWGDQDALVTFTSGYDRHRGHNHRDENSFTFSEYGEQFGIDPGYEPWETRSHNAILVDGIGQDHEANQYDVVGHVIDHQDFGDALYVKGDAKDAYLDAANVAIAIRKLLFVKGSQPYIIIADDIQKTSGTGQFTWLFHTTTSNQIAVDTNASATITGSKHGAQCYIKILWPASIVQVSQTNLAGQTFVARDVTYPYSNYFKELSAVATATNPRFVTFISAAPAGTAQPKVRKTGTPDDMQITVTSNDGTVDVIEVTRDNMTFSRSK